MSHQPRRATAVTILALMLTVLSACADEGTGPVAANPQFAANSSNGAMVFEFQYGIPSGVILRDADNQLALYYRWNNGFPCAGVAATDFVETTSFNVSRPDEWWRQREETDGLWFYVYPWNGTAAVNCPYLANTTPLATGRGHRVTLDNDFFPWEPYVPGPGANAYADLYRGSLTTPSGAPVEFMGQMHITIAADGQTVKQYHLDLRLSPDPR